MSNRLLACFFFLEENIHLIYINKFIQECKSQKKQLIIFPDGQHNTTWLSHDYTTQIRKFLAEVNLPQLIRKNYFFVINSVPDYLNQHRHQHLDLVKKKNSCCMSFFFHLQNFLHIYTYNHSMYNSVGIFQCCLINFCRHYYLFIPKNSFFLLLSFFGDTDDISKINKCDISKL